MSGPELGLALSVFLACAVETVEAVTIVLVVGTTRSCINFTATPHIPIRLDEVVQLWDVHRA